MRCLNHAARESAGYCVACGDFFCGECLVLCDDSRQYCSRCREKLRKYPQGMREQATEDRLATKLLVKFKNGNELRGTTYKIDPNRLGFNLVVHSGKGVSDEIYVEFADVKYVALLESLRGEKRVQTQEYQPKGSEVEVTFKDGEVLKGFTLKHYDDREPRFSVIPANRRSGLISTMVERSAVASMSLGRIPKAQEMRTLIDNGVKRLIMHYYWRHPDIVITVAELAARLGREPHVIDRELTDFEHEGLIHRIGAAGSGQLRFTPSKDHIVRETVSALGREIDQLYFRKRSKPEAPKPAQPQKTRVRWPL